VQVADAVPDVRAGSVRNAVAHGNVPVPAAVTAVPACVTAVPAPVAAVLGERGPRQQRQNTDECENAGCPKTCRREMHTAPLSEIVVEAGSRRWLDPERRFLWIL